jgi:hypothetical protein
VFAVAAPLLLEEGVEVMGEILEACISPQAAPTTAKRAVEIVTPSFLHLARIWAVRSFDRISSCVRV